MQAILDLHKAQLNEFSVEEHQLLLKQRELVKLVSQRQGQSNHEVLQQMYRDMKPQTKVD
jgi:hypothetical protein